MADFAWGGACGEALGLDAPLGRRLVTEKGVGGGGEGGCSAGEGGGGEGGGGL